MTLTELTHALDGLGVRLALRIAVDAPSGGLTDPLRAALEAHRPALIARLASVVFQTAESREASREALAASRRDEVRPHPSRNAVRRRTPWGTVVLSDPSEPPIEVFGP